MNYGGAIRVYLCSSVAQWHAYGGINMSQEARDIMQELRNRVDTQSHGWTAFKAASTLGYI
jgi:hypothetical protein